MNDRRGERLMHGVEDQAEEWRAQDIDASRTYVSVELAGPQTNPGHGNEAKTSVGRTLDALWRKLGRRGGGDPPIR